MHCTCDNIFVLYCFLSSSWFFSTISLLVVASSSLAVVNYLKMVLYHIQTLETCSKLAKRWKQHQPSDPLHLQKEHKEIRAISRADVLIYLLLTLSRHFYTRTWASSTLLQLNLLRIFRFSILRKNILLNHYIYFISLNILILHSVRGNAN